MARSRHTSPMYPTIKRAFDVIFSALIVALAFIPVTIVCLIIAIESGGGNPLFTQERIGKDGRPIRIIKIRTMVRDSNDLEKYFTADQLEEFLLEYKIDNDPRITRTGNLLRASSLDELPQFLNVLMGDMSVVGPRPITERELANYGDTTDELLSVVPGVTGWWQVTERNKATYANGRRQELELYYVRNQSIHLDIRILVRTVSAVLNRTGK